MSADFVTEITKLARELAPSLTDADLDRIDTALRERFGGQEVWIASRIKRPPDIESVDARLRRAMPVTKIAEDLGVSRTTIYRWIRKTRNERAQRGRSKEKSR